LASRIADGARVSLADLDLAERVQVMLAAVELLEERAPGSGLEHGDGQHDARDRAVPRPGYRASATRRRSDDGTATTADP
jgi:hypothetical protein